MKAEHRQRYLKLLAAADTTPEDDLHEMMLSRCEKGMTLSADVERLNLELSGLRPVKPSARELHFASKAVKQARESAIASGAITAAVADEAEKRFMAGKSVDLGKMELSRKVEDDDHKAADGLANLLAFYEAVASNKPAPKPGEQSGHQGLELARKVPGSPDEPDAAPDPEENPFVQTAERLAGKKAKAKK